VASTELYDNELVRSRQVEMKNAFEDPGKEMADRNVKNLDCLQDLTR
jgi:hypothetical protein